jgi:hypothetical protein
MTVHLFNTLDSAMLGPGRIERKFYITPRQVDIAHGMLRQVCRPDGEYPTCLVNSLYFDTFDLDEYHDSQSGDFGKDKVRIRWYGEDGSPDGARTIYVELKSKQGFVGTKQRQEMEVPAYCLAMPHLARGIVPRALLSDVLSHFGHFPAKMLCPVVKITYLRYRFIEPLTGQRVALDCRIKSTMVGPRPGAGEKELELDGAVLEIKGTSFELPATLRRMGMLDVDWSQFSKYSACIDAHDERPGAIGRLSPPGRVIR